MPALERIWAKTSKKTLSLSWNTERLALPLALLAATFGADALAPRRLPAKVAPELARLIVDTRRAPQAPQGVPHASLKWCGGKRQVKVRESIEVSLPPRVEGRQGPRCVSCRFGFP